MDFKALLLLTTCLSTACSEIYYPNHNYDNIDASINATLPRQTQPQKRENNGQHPPASINPNDVNPNASRPPGTKPMRENIVRQGGIMGRIRPHPEPLKRKRYGSQNRYSPHLKDSFGGYGDIKKYRKYPTRGIPHYMGGYSSHRPRLSKPINLGPGFAFGNSKPKMKNRPQATLGSLSFSNSGSNLGPPSGFTSNSFDEGGFGSASSEFGNIASESQSYGGGGFKGDGELAGRVKIKVFRGPTQKVGHKYFAPWGYYVSQPNDANRSKGHQSYGHY